jgi:HEAT repeat protein
MPKFVLSVAVVLSLCTGVAAAREGNISELLAQLSSTDEAVRLRAIDLLGEQCEGAPEVLQALSGELKSVSTAVRAHAAHALGHLGAAARPAVESLAPLLADPDPKVRRMAIRSWARIRPGPAVTIPLLSKVLSDGDPAVRNEAMEIVADVGKPAVPMLATLLGRDRSVYWCTIALGEIGADAAEAAPALIDVLKNNRRPEVRREAALALGSIGPAAADSVPTLIASLRDRDPAVVAGAAYALGCIGPRAKDAESALIRLTTSRDALQKAVSVWSLAKIDPEDRTRKQAAVTQLVAALKDDQPQLRYAALRGLADLKPAPEVVLPALTKAVEDADMGVAGAALHVLASLDERGLPALTDALKRKDLCPVTARILGQMGSRAAAAAPALVEIAKSGRSSAAQSEALMALAAIGADPKEVVPVATAALFSQHEDVCCAACYALGQIGKRAAAAEPELRKKIGDSDEAGSLAAWALVRISPDSPQAARQLVPLFVKSLADCEPRVRVEAAASLQRLGPLAKDAIPVLKDASRDPDETVHAAAVAALNAIENPVARSK